MVSQFLNKQKYVIKKTLLVCLIVFCSVLNVNVSWAEDDFQYWSLLTFTHKLNDQWELIFNPAIRVRDDASDVQYWQTRVGLAYKIDEYWKVNLHYYHNEIENAAGTWIEENRVELQPTFSWKWKGLSLSNRFRFEYRLVDGDERWRYRSKFKAAKPFEIRERTFKGYVDNEIFYDDFVDSLNQNRASFGIGTRLHENVWLDVFYMYKANKGAEDWRGENIVGTHLKFSL